MRVKNFFKPGITIVSMCMILFFSPAYAQQNPKLSDAEVASVAVVANQIDIDYAGIANRRSKNGDVVKFAETIESDHQDVIGQAAALVKKFGVTPKDNAVSQKLLADAKKMKATLNNTPK